LAQGYERPDGTALADLTDLLQHVGEELSAWRRRSLKAEAELAEAKSKGGVLSGPELIQARQRAIELDVEGQVLQERITAARDRLQLLATRLAFLENEAGDIP
jgi:hypothetical protein